jgi:hypothetical protein
VSEALEPLSFGAFMTVFGAKALDEIVENRAFQRSLFQSEVPIRAEVKDPELSRDFRKRRRKPVIKCRLVRIPSARSVEIAGDKQFLEQID